VRQGRAYVVTFTAPSSRFEADLPGFRAILRSWRWRS
jgi:hypothetical protein